MPETKKTADVAEEEAADAVEEAIGGEETDEEEAVADATEAEAEPEAETDEPGEFGNELQQTYKQVDSAHHDVALTQLLRAHELARVAGKAERADAPVLDKDRGSDRERIGTDIYRLRAAHRR